MRRLGQVMEEMRDAGKLAKGTRGQFIGRGKIIGGGKNPPPIDDTLAQQGIDKDLAKAARKAAAQTDDEHERDIAKACRIAVAAAEDDKAVIEQATSIRMRAEIRAGELLIEMAERGERPKGRKKESHVATLSSIGINKTQSSRWQKLALLSPEKQERAKPRSPPNTVLSC